MEKRTGWKRRQDREEKRMEQRRGWSRREDGIVKRMEQRRGWSKREDGVEQRMGQRRGQSRGMDEVGGEDWVQENCRSEADLACQQRNLAPALLALNHGSGLLSLTLGWVRYLELLAPDFMASLDFLSLAPGLTTKYKIIRVVSEVCNFPKFCCKQICPNRRTSSNNPSR